MTETAESSLAGGEPERWLEAAPPLLGAPPGTNGGAVARGTKGCAAARSIVARGGVLGAGGADPPPCCCRCAASHICCRSGPPEHSE